MGKLERFTCDDGNECLVLEPGVVFAYEPGTEEWLFELANQMSDSEYIAKQILAGSDNIDCGSFRLEPSFSTGIRFEKGFHAPADILEIECGNYPATLYYECPEYNGHEYPQRNDPEFAARDMIRLLREGMYFAGLRK